MLRMFDTHQIRKTRELSGRLWDVTLLSGDREGEKRKVMVPGCLEALPGLGNYRGWSAYETTFSAGGNVRLECKGVSHFARVYVDGEEVTRHYNSYTPFSVCLRNLEDGEHTLRILVDNEFREEYALDMPNDYMSYGGISRGVALESVPDCYIRWMHVTPLRAEGEDWIADVKVLCENLSDQTQRAAVRLRIAGEETEKQEREMKPGETLFSFPELRIHGVQTWDMEHPALYLAQAVLEQNGEETDDWIDRIGFRTVAVEGRRVLLNGKPLRIKGFCRHEDHPQYGCALPAEAITYDLALIRDLGANSVRTSHYPNDEIFLDLCDEMGILVWEENHARGIPEERMRNPHFEPQCEQVIREMITEHYNHPSIYIWGILNECASDTEYGRSCYQAQYDLIRSLDTSRPCTSASCKFNKDLCQDLPDVCSWNMYPYWYEERSASQMLRDTMDWVETAGNGAGKPFLVSEIGAGAIYGFRDPSMDVWSEERQAEILGKQLREVAACEECMGMYIWQFCDVRVAREGWAMHRPRTRNNKGVVDEYRRPKLSYAAVREVFQSLPDYWDER
ncbi:MAG: glycoside hydrolase family 2 TIM barrel-domain containing protein [Eubacteriales bacterium]|nr:glycoside hydrolase family 2 TIM barrel-domain containing protein [Eubacteriales bacterium]